MKKNKELDSFFCMIDSFKDMDYNKFHNKLIYDNEFGLREVDSLINVFERLDECNKILDKDRCLILIEEGLNINCEKILMELNVSVMFHNINDVINKLIGYLKKKKIKYYMKISLCGELCRFSVVLLDEEYLVKVVDFINDKLGKNIEDNEHLLFCDDKVSLSFNMDYSYDKILSMYLYDFINSNDEKIKSYANFKKYILDNYFKVVNQVDMHQLLKFNKENVCLSKFFKNLEIITTLIVYLINEKDIEDYYDYFRKLKKSESKNNNGYDIYDNLEVNRELFNELVSKMYFKYGEDYARNSIVNYINTGKRGYITRENDLRKKIVESKTFMIFLYQINFSDEFDKIIDCYKFDKKKKMLEIICRETYLTCNDFEKKNSGKIHIARTLIRISCGDYSSVTRRNDARKIAMENIRPDEVIDLIKKTLKIDYVKKEASLYELYAEYIENLCVV